MSSITDYFRSAVREHFVAARRRQVEQTLSGQMTPAQRRELERHGAQLLASLNPQLVIAQLATPTTDLTRPQTVRLGRRGFFYVYNEIYRQFQLQHEPSPLHSPYSWSFGQPLTDEEADALAQRQAERRKLQEEMREQHRRAHEKSMALLRSHLSTEQKEQLDSRLRFRVTGKSGRRYWINADGNLTYNIGSKDEHGNRVNICCTPGYPGTMPLGDVYLGQKLALELDEENFLEDANEEYAY